jgi:hypothetical protein
MGRLWDIATRPFNRERYKGTVIPDYVTQVLLGDALSLRPTPSPSAPQVQLTTSPRLTQTTRKVAVDNGFWSPLMPADQVAIDYTEEVPYSWALLATRGLVTVFQRRVPYGMAWYVDNFYFFARSLGGVGNPVLLPPAALMGSILMRVFTSKSQLSYGTISSDTVGLIPQEASVPFLNDRIGPREAKFGITLFGGDVIRAYIQTASRPNVVPVPPPFPITTIGFRMMGLQGAKNDIEDYLRWKKWDR